jgi:sugar lactone lactonase YvrE
VKGDKIYAATATHVFAIDANKEYETYSKINSLNDLGVSGICWDAATEQLLIAYQNSNLDVLDVKGRTKNIGDIQRSNFPGNKIIRNLYCANGLGYLSTGLGIIVVNLRKYEIKDTWVIGNNGIQTGVSGFTQLNNFFYAATDEGLKQIEVTNANPSNFANWQNISGSNGLSSGALLNVLAVNGQLVVQKNDSLMILSGSSWKLLYKEANWLITGLNSSAGKLLVCQRSTAGAARVLQLNVNGVIEKTTSQAGVISLPRYATLVDNTLWVADQFGGLAAFNNGLERFIPNGPPGIASGAIVGNSKQMVLAAGSINSAWNYQYNRNGVYFFSDQWNSRSYFNTPALDSVLDFITVAIDPADQSVWAGSFGGGLVHFPNTGALTLYKKGNSSLQETIGDPGSYRVSGLAFDANGRLWVSNYGSPVNLHVRKTDGKWQAFSVPFPLAEQASGALVCDDNDQVWMVSPKNNGLICYKYAQIETTSDDQWKKYTTGSNQGNLPSNNVLSIVKDRTGSIWVGTDKGIAIIRCPSEVFTTSGCAAYLPVVKQGNFFGFLFKDEYVQCMAVDGANRKWVGTQNGLWLLSETGEQVLQQFTASNSPLLSNNVLQVGIQPETGEVFVLTDLGICSYRSTATEPADATQQVLVFPNPVPPGYTGTIAIRGMKENAIVKITELNGTLVYQTRSQGGQAVWNGTNYKGEKVASGVYLVLIRDDENTDKLATKIVIVSGR